MLLLHVAIYTSSPFFAFASDLSLECEFKDGDYNKCVQNLKKKDTLKASEKVCLAFAYFRLGNLQYTEVILDAENQTRNIRDGLPNDLEISHLLTKPELGSLSRNDKSEVFTHLGYLHIGIGNNLEARKSFTAAFRYNPYLEFDTKTFGDSRFKTVIEEAKIAAQMKRELLPLDLFVAVDVSESVPREQVEKIVKLQYAVQKKLNPDDSVLFYHFGESSRQLPSLVSPPASAPIVRSLRTDFWTDFSALFKKVSNKIREEESENSTKRQKAVLIISDGDHSVENNPGGGEERIPPAVSKAIKVFSESHPDVTVVIITTDRIIKADDPKPGGGYATQWTKKLMRHCIGKSFYYESGSRPQEILAKIFDVIVPHRDKVLIMQNQDEEKGYVFNKQGQSTVELVIRCTLPKVDLVVRGYPDGKTDSSLFGCKWKQTGTKILHLTGRNTYRNEDLKIICLKPDEAFPTSQEAFEFTLIFSHLPAQGTNQYEDKICKISLLFRKQLPTIEITRLFDETVIMKTSEKNLLKFRSKIDFSDHFKQPITFNVSIPKNNCFSAQKERVSIPIDTTSSPGQHEFNLSVQANSIDNRWGKESDDNVLIDFNTNNTSSAYSIDAKQVGAIDFRVVPSVFYYPYKYLSPVIWWLFGFVFICIASYAFVARIYKITTSDNASDLGEGFRVHGNTIYDDTGRQILRLRQWWYLVRFEPTADNFNSYMEKSIFLERCSGKKDKSEKEINIFQWRFIKRTRRYQIILQQNSGASNIFNVNWNSSSKKWNEILRNFIWIFGIIFIFLTYISWPLFLWVITVSVVLLISLIAYLFRRYIDHGQLSVSKSLKLGAGLVDIITGIIETCFALF